MTQIPPSVSSLRVPSSYNFEDDVSRVYEGIQDELLRRPANHRVCLKEVLLNNDKLIWAPRFEPYFFSRFPIKNVEYFVFNALLRSEAELDAFLIHEALEHHPEETEDSYDSV
ncbi:hypothetical protein RF11_12358 [Thelohanellus kitauei]|uniref:Uncharacterized protein n=1 Tax=Thelohanellus kitauei TaxID=669202 RepID=A0A0C2MZU6_THEKT|nr:hypothetical protein RF11_12358 [Thelohanellus kitauei]